MRYFILVLWSLLLMDTLQTHAATTVAGTGATADIVYVGQTAQINLKLENRSLPALDNATLEASLTNYWGEKVSLPSETISLGADSVRMRTYSFPCTRAGYWALGMRIVKDGTVKAENTRAWSIAVFDQPHTFPAAADSPLGTYMIGNTAMVADIVPKGFYADMATMGARWGTMDTWWSLLEPTNNNYNWAYYDEWFQKMRDAGVTPIPHLFATPQWASSYTTGKPGEYYEYPPADWAQWRQFVHDFVDRYKDWLVYLRIWNEPNVGFWRGTPQQYAQMVIAASEEAKAVKPGIKIIIEVVDDAYQKNNVYPFLDAVHAAGATPYWDVVGIHNYWLNNANPPERTVFTQRYQMFIDWRNAHKSQAEAWDTEFACMSESWSNGFWVGVGETKQAQWLARAHAIGFSKGLKKMFWFPGYSWPDPAPGGTSPYYNPAGLLRMDLSPKPAYVAYRTMALALSEATFAGDLTGLGTDQYGKKFQRADDFVTMLWSVDAAHAGEIYLQCAGASQVTVVDLMGESRTIKPGASGGFPLTVSENVQYVYSSVAPVVGHSEAGAAWAAYE